MSIVILSAIAELRLCFQLIVVFAMVAAALAGVPGERQERNAVYSTYNGLVASPLAYAATPYAASPYAYSAGVYSGVPAISTYSSYPGEALDFSGTLPYFTIP